MSRWGWAFIRYDQEKLKPSLCHPLYVRERNRYILERYGARPEEITRLVNFHMDLGGMIRVGPDGDQELTVWLSPDYRSFTVWKHQAKEVMEVIQNRPFAVHHGRVTFFKFGRWPGTVCFISKTDRSKILRALKSYQVDEVGNMRRRVEMEDVLVSANIAIDPKRNEAEVRKMLGMKPKKKERRD